MGCHTFSVRRFGYIGGGSEKFWEIDRAGGSVTVRFGRIGTAGQTQVKDLGSDQAAGAQVAKLVAEKVRKGYVEGGSAPAAPGAASPTTPKPMPAPPRATADEDRDEDAWTVPPAWWRQAEPFRGRSPARAFVPDPAAAEVVAGVRARGRFTHVLDHPNSDVELVALARRHMSRSAGSQADPLGAAVVATIISIGAEWRDRDRLPAIADEWVADQGVVFSAEAAAFLDRVHLTTWGAPAPGKYPDLIVLPVAPGVHGNRNGDPAILARVRAFLAAADDSDYASATARLAELRTGAIGTHLVTSYLLPTEQQWVDADIALALGAGAGTLLSVVLPSVTTEPQATAILDATGIWPATLPPAFHSMAAQIGPDVAPVLARIFDTGIDAARKRRVVSMLGEIPTDTAFGLLLDRLDQKHVQPVVLEAIARFPRRAARLLAEVATGSGQKATAAREFLRGHAISHPGVVERVRPELSAAAMKVVDSITASGARVPEAEADRQPSVLVTPPWTARRARPNPVVVEGIGRATPTVLRWRPGERALWAEADSDDWYLSEVQDWTPWVVRAITGNDWRQLGIFAMAPEEMVRPHLGRAQPAGHYDALPSLRRVLARFEEDAAGFALRCVAMRPASMAPVLLPLEGSEIAARIADWYARSKAVRPVALAWFDRHPAAAARDLVPPALGKPGKERSNAEAALRALDQGGHRDEIRAAAAALGAEATEAIDAMLAVDPLQLLPARIPAPPAWLDPVHLPQVLLRDRTGALPAPAVGHLITMLAMSKPGDTYAGVDLVREAVDPASLADMAWAVFERWGAAGYPNKEAWALDALGMVGDDETVRRLAPLIRVWPGEAAHKRAVNALDVLSAIGTDVALMHLHGIAEKAKFAGLKNAARTKMEEVADGLGLTADQLADRLVPDFGLDDDGAMLLDYGDRRFRVGFDEQLKPVVADEDGSRRKLLPKPGPKDDATLAPAAYARFAGLKKDVKTVAADQIRRFEQAMVNGRRWTAAEQRTLFVEHPLLRHLARRLVWVTFDGEDRPAGSFRVAEDQSLADAGDDELTLTGDTVVGIAHPLQLDDTLGAWSDVFADYEILQPFPQLGRDVHHLTAEERTGRILHRFVGTTAYTGKVLGLSHRGWARGSPMDAGVSNVTYKVVPGGRAVIVDLDPGIIAGAAMDAPEQTIAGVWLNDGPADYGNSRGNLAFDLLDEITASELLRDLEMLRS